MKKTCLHCNQEKNINDFGKYKKRSGEIAHRNVCKTCKNKQDKQVKNNNVPTKVKQNKANMVQNLSCEDYIKLNEQQKQKLFLLIDNTEKIISMSKNKIEIQTDNKANRKVRTINLDEVLYKSIKENQHTKSANSQRSEKANKKNKYCSSFK